MAGCRYPVCSYSIGCTRHLFEYALFVRLDTEQPVSAVYKAKKDSYYQNSDNEYFADKRLKRNELCFNGMGIGF